MGLAKKLIVKPEAVPTLLPSTTVQIPIQSEPPVYEIALATNPMQVRTVHCSFLVPYYMAFYGSKVTLESDCIFCRWITLD